VTLTIWFVVSLFEFNSGSWFRRRAAGVLAKIRLRSLKESKTRPSCIPLSKLRFSTSRVASLPRIWTMYVTKMPKIESMKKQKTGCRKAMTTFAKFKSRLYTNGLRSSVNKSQATKAMI